MFSNSHIFFEGHSHIVGVFNNFFYFPFLKKKWPPPNTLAWFLELFNDTPRKSLPENIPCNRAAWGSIRCNITPLKRPEVPTSTVPTARKAKGPDTYHNTPAPLTISYPYKPQSSLQPKGQGVAVLVNYLTLEPLVQTFMNDTEIGWTSRNLSGELP